VLWGTETWKKRRPGLLLTTGNAESDGAAYCLQIFIQDLQKPHDTSLTASPSHDRNLYPSPSCCNAYLRQPEHIYSHHRNPQAAPMHNPVINDKTIMFSHRAAALGSTDAGAATKHSVETKPLL